MKAKQILEDNARCSLVPAYAKKLCEAFGVEFDEKLVYLKLRYREDANEVPRVAVYELAEFICTKLGLEPDNKKLDEACIYFGEGRRVECTTLGWTANLPEGDEVEA